MNCIKVLGDESRIKIYHILSETPETDYSVKDIVCMLKIGQPTVSYHLQSLNKTGLLSRSRVGKEVFYKVNKICPHYKNTCILQTSL
jgi:DNA-binding transcriptional ArsR family regulator